MGYSVLNVDIKLNIECRMKALIMEIRIKISIEDTLEVEYNIWDMEYKICDVK